jgi:Protein of unknown function (DUF1549)/Protein of unknown function (DUF1553)
MRFSLTRHAFLIAVTLMVANGSRAEEPLHDRIDRLIQAGAEGNSLAAPATDAAFLRRVCLDFSGRIPSATEARAFLDNSSNDKRTALVDRLLQSPEYAHRMASLFHALLMEQRGDNKDWQQYLHDSFAENKSWDQVARDIIKPNVEDENTRAAIFFYQKRLERNGANPVDYPSLTNDVARLFLGKNLQCAQCHDHLFIDDYKQADFQGLYAAFLNVSVKNDPRTKYPAVFEEPMKARLEFISVFDSTARATGPRFPGGLEIEIPEVQETKEATENDAGFSPLARFAEEMPSENNKLFSANIANRLWFIMMGRGIVHPLDLHHSGNPPSHPELLVLIGDAFAEHHFDIQWMLRELALTRTYARSSVQPEADKAAPPSHFLVSIERRLSAEQLLQSTLQATGELDRVTEIGEEADTHPSGPTIKELRKAFVDAFSNEAKEPEDEFKASVKGALFLMNSDLFLKLLKPRPGNLIQRLSEITDASVFADELFLSVFSRRPTQEEITEVSEYLDHNAERRTVAIGQLAWAMLTSMEFYVNH